MLLAADEYSLRRHIAQAAVRLPQFLAFGADRFEQARSTALDMDFERLGTNALIRVTGPLSYKYDFMTWWMDGTCYQGISGKLFAAANDDSIDRIVLAVDSPGGEYTGCPELGKQIREIRDMKEVVAVVDPLAASAGYWIASQASRIVSLGTGRVGSLGVMLHYTSYFRYLQEEGIDIAVIRAAISPDKNAAHPYEAMNEKAKAALQADCDDAGQVFVDAVASGRGIAASEVLEKFGQGRMFDGEKAKNLSMVDEIGSLASVLAEKRGSTIKTSAKRRMGTFSANQIRRLELQ